METYGEVGVLMNLAGDSPGGEILKSLLTTPKMQKSEQCEVNILQNLETRAQQEEQIVFQIEVAQTIKSEFISSSENIIQHIPVTYVTSDSQNLTPGCDGTLAEPVTYVVSRDGLQDASGYCTVGGEDPQKVFLLQEISTRESQTVYGNLENKSYAAKESQTSECECTEVCHPDEGVEPCIGKREMEGREAKKRKTTGNSPGSRGKRGKKENAISCGQHNTAKAERKIPTCKKPLSKWKNSKLKCKLKASGKGFLARNQTKSMRTEEWENTPTGEEEQVAEVEKEKEKGEGERRNLFELTKLEDNVEQVARRLKIGCECSESNCFEGLNPNDVFKHRLNIADLTKAEHDMYLMGVIMASIHNLEETCRRKERIRIRSCYAYQGKKVCLTAFLYLQHVSLYQMKRLRSHLKNHGVSPRIHGNRGRKPANTFSLDIYRRAKNFVQAYIEEHCVKTVPNFSTRWPNIKPQPDSVAHDRKPIIKEENKWKTANKMTSYHLPPECTKRVVHGEYRSFCESFKPSQKVMKYSTFTNFLKKQFPNVKFQKREEKKPERKTEEAERWKPKEERPGTEKWEEGEKKPKEEPGVDKSVQVDKSWAYVPVKTGVIVNGRRLSARDVSGNLEPGYGVAVQVPGGQSYVCTRTENSKQYFAIDSTV